MSNKALMSYVRKKFRNKGITLQSGARDILLEALAAVQDSAGEDAMKGVLERVLRDITSSDLKSNQISRAVMDDVLTKLNNAGAAAVDTKTMLQVIDAFSVPRYEFNQDKKRFFPAKEKPSICAAADDKSKFFAERYHVIKQRLLRLPDFSMASDKKPTRFKLTPISAFLGLSTGDHDEEDTLEGDNADPNAPRRERGAPVLSLGMISQLELDKFYIEDLDSKAEINLDNATYHDALLTETSIVLVQGVYRDGVLHASTLKSPNAELKIETEAAFAGMNFFGGDFNEERRDDLYEAEKENVGGMFVVLSDVWLDRRDVILKLKTLLATYADIDPQPIAYIFMGNFTSKPHGVHSCRIIQEGLNELADTIAELFITSHFIFVPGALDPGSPAVLPRFPLPTSATKRFEARIPNAVFTTNPCRIRYGAQEIVVCREDLASKLRRNCIMAPSAESIDNPDSIDSHITKTLLDQSTLVPLPLHTQPALWSYGASLMLYPTPDVLITGDRGNSYHMSYCECICMNPGPFLTSDFGFISYYPGKMRIQYEKQHGLSQQTAAMDDAEDDEDNEPVEMCNVP